MMQIILQGNVKIEIGMTDTHKVLTFTDTDSKVQVLVPLDRLSAAEIGQRLCGTLAQGGGD